MSHLTANSNRSSLRSAGSTIAALCLMTLLVGCGAEGSSPSDTTAAVTSEPQEEEWVVFRSARTGDRGRHQLSEPQQEEWVDFTSTRTGDRGRHQLSE